MVNTKKRVVGEDLYDAPLATNLNGSIAYPTTSGKNATDHAATRSYDTNEYVPSGKNATDHAAQRVYSSEPAASTNNNGNGFQYGTYNYGTFSYDPYVRGNFSYKDAPEYINRYQQQIDELSNEILHWQGFNYNVNADPLYQQYAEQYNRNGQNAMRNTLAQMAARTGGMGSSYAGTAAQNAYNEYMQGLNDKVPELYQLAYSMYNDKLNKRRNDLSMLEALEQGDYGKYVDLLQQYNADRNVAYNAWNATEGSKEDADRAKMSMDYNVWKAQQDNAYNVWKAQQDNAYNQWLYQQDQAAKELEYQRSQSDMEANYKAQLQQLQDALANLQLNGTEEKTETPAEEPREIDYSKYTRQPDYLDDDQGGLPEKKYTGPVDYLDDDQGGLPEKTVERQVLDAIDNQMKNGASSQQLLQMIDEAIEAGLLKKGTVSGPLGEIQKKYGGRYGK